MLRDAHRVHCLDDSIDDCQPLLPPPHREDRPLRVRTEHKTSEVSETTSRVRDALNVLVSGARLRRVQNGLEAGHFEHP